MFRYLAPIIAAVAIALVPVAARAAAAAPAPDLFSVSGVHVDATAESATAARDKALQAGRPIAWQRLYRRLAPQSAWDKQPQLDDKALERIVRSFEVANERRSTTRYLADVTYHFNANDVRRLMRDVSAPLAETRSKPAVIVPVVAGKGFDPNSDWAKAWSDPSVSDGIVPLVLPASDAPDLAAVAHADPGTLDWSAVRSLAEHYDAAEVVVAQLGNNGAIVVRYILPSGSETQSVTIASGAYATATDAVSRKLGDAWKLRSAVDYTKSSVLTVSAPLTGLQDWSTIRSRLSQIKAVTDVQVRGMSVAEAQMQITYYGRVDQLTDAMAQQNLELKPDSSGGTYTLRVGAVSASANP
jgi:hypothetical protein